MEKREKTDNQTLEPVAEKSPATDPQDQRTEDGKFASSEAAKANGRKGGLARAERRRLLGNIGLAKVADNPTLGPHWDEALKWLEAEVKDLAFQCDGFIGPGPMMVLKTAAASLAASLWVIEMCAIDNSPVLLDKFKNLQQAHAANWSLAKKEALADAVRRRNSTSNDPYAAFRNIIAEDKDDEDDDE